jgi:aryl sulfotransferase
VLIHYDDLAADLGGQMRHLADRLGITVPEQAWPGLVQAATFTHMQANAEHVVGVNRILKTSTAFFRRGTSGAGHEILTDEQIARYHARTSQMAPQDMLTWLHSTCRSRPV